MINGLIDGFFAFALKKINEEIQNHIIGKTIKLSWCFKTSHGDLFKLSLYFFEHTMTNYLKYHGSTITK